MLLGEFSVLFSLFFAFHIAQIQSTNFLSVTYTTAHHPFSHHDEMNISMQIFGEGEERKKIFAMHPSICTSMFFLSLGMLVWVWKSNLGISHANEFREDNLEFMHTETLDGYTKLSWGEVFFKIGLAEDTDSSGLSTSIRMMTVVMKLHGNSFYYLHHIFIPVGSSRVEKSSSQTLFHSLSENASHSFHMSEGQMTWSSREER